jgi:type VI secretion system secreted protein Hcp
MDSGETACMKVSSLLALCSAVLLAAFPAHAASDFLLVLDGIPGESTDEQHPRSIEIFSFSLGAANSGTIGGTGGGTGKVSFSDLSLMKALDKASPLLYLQCAQGKHIPTATLYVRKTGGDKVQEYYVIKLTDVLISSVQTSGANGGGQPTESLSLNFAKIEFSYSAQKPDGSVEQVKSGWDIALNKPI